MAFASPFHLPWRSSIPRAALGGVWDCAIDGRPFVFDRTSDGYKQGIQSIEVLRQQSDTSDQPGEGSINREDSWRSGQSSFHHGAGQRYRDKSDADPYRFWASKGVNVWTKDELSLLPATVNKRTQSDPNPSMVVAGDFLYISDGANLYKYDGTTWTLQTFTGGNTSTITGIATNGFSLWITTNSNSTWTGTTASNTFGTWLSGTTYDSVSYTRGRLVVTSGKAVYEVNASNATTPLNPSEGNNALKWNAFTEGGTAIYGAATSGNRSTIYKIVPPSDSPSGALGVPVPAAPALPTGETIYALYGYLGQIILGTSKGIRVADEGANSFLTIGPLVAINSPVRCFDGSDNFVWFGWTGLDSSSSGLGRIDLGQQVDAGVYAYASDVYAPVSGNVTDCVVYQGIRYFYVSGYGLFAEGTSFVSSGFLQTGIIRYGVIDDKVARRVELRHKKLSGSVEVQLDVDQSGFESLGTSSLEGTVAPNRSFDSELPAGASHEMRVILYPGASGSPVVQHVELRADVVPNRGLMIYTAVELTDRAIDKAARNPLEDYEALVAMANLKRAVTFQMHEKIFIVTITDFQFIPTNKTRDSRFANGTMILKMKAAS